MTYFTSRLTKSFTALFCIVFCTPALGDRTYFVEAYSGFGPGWSIDGGTLTTSEFIGTVNASDIAAVLADWSIGMSSPSGSLTLTPANSTFVLSSDVVGRPGILEVDESHLLLPFDAFGYNLSLTADSGQEILWRGPDYDDNISGLMVDYESITLSDGSGSSLVHFGRCFVGEGNCPMEDESVDGRIVASVPEPTSLVLLAVGMSALLRYSFRSQEASTGSTSAVA